MSDLSFFAPTLFVLSAALLLGVTGDVTKRWARLAWVALSLLVLFWYLPWRLRETVLPADILTVGGAWIWFLFGVELIFLFDYFKQLVVRSRLVNRSREADQAYERLSQKPKEEWPSVDVMIPTYNEPKDVLERSIIGASALDYPNFQVWVLDDGHRAWLKDLCADLKVNYCARTERDHAKAGNLNNAIQQSSADLICVFDADFVPYKWFLKRVAGFFDDPKIGIVQTPQHFFNRDPVQRNLWIADLWPDEQRLFFDKIAPSMDAWDSMFCCGSCVTYRREAVEAIGGIPTASITEDILTSLEMHRKGYITRYLNEKLSIGLAAESLQAFYIQRERWCQGGIQTLFLPSGPLGPGLSLIKRILLFPIYWVFHIPANLLVLSIPIFFFWFGLEPLANARSDEILFWQLPMLVLGWAASLWYNGRQAYPILTEGPAALVSVRLLPIVLSSLIRPFGKPFKVTPKGTNTDHKFFSKVDVTVLATLLIGNLGGFLVNLSPDNRIVEQEGLLLVAGFWAVYNSLVLSLALLISFESKVYRQDDRFPVALEAKLMGGDGLTIAGTITDLSVGGASFEPHTPLEAPLKGGEGWVIDIPDLVDLRARVARQGGREIGFEFEPEICGQDRIDLIQFLYTSGIDNAAKPAHATTMLWALLNRFWGHQEGHQPKDKRP